MGVAVQTLCGSSRAPGSRSTCYSRRGDGHSALTIMFSLSGFRAVAVIGLCGLLSGAALAASEPVLEITPPDSNGWPRLNTPGQTGMVYTIQASTNLAQWTPIASTHDRIAEYPDAAAPGLSH